MWLSTLTYAQREAMLRLAHNVIVSDGLLDPNEEGMLEAFRREMAVSADFETPYVIALIDLAEGPRMMSQIIDADPDALAVGLPVKVDFAAWSEDITLPVFRLYPALDGGGA